MDARLVRERAVARDRVHERHVHLHRLRDQVLDLTEHRQVVLALHVLGVRSVQARDEAAERGDTDTLANTEHGRVNVRRTGLERAVSVRDRHTGVVVEMHLDVARNDTAEGADEVVYLAGVCAADGVSNTDTVDTNAVDRLVDGEEVDEVGPERVFRREADLDACAFLE